MLLKLKTLSKAVHLADLGSERLRKIKLILLALSLFPHNLHKLRTKIPLKMQIFVFVELIIKELCSKYCVCESTYNQAYLYTKYIYLRILNNYQNRSLDFNLF